MSAPGTVGGTDCQLLPAAGIGGVFGPLLVLLLDSSSSSI